MIVYALSACGNMEMGPTSVELKNGVDFSIFVNGVVLRGPTHLNNIIDYMIFCFKKKVIYTYSLEKMTTVENVTE